MKTNGTANACSRSMMIGMLFLIATVTRSQTAPIYKFANPTLISGTDKQVNAVYRFPAVIPGIDGLVKINSIVGGISLRNIDRTADGYSEAFQPEYKINSLTNAYIEFQITFVNAGTSTAHSQALVDASGLDIDGDANGINLLKEFNTIDMGGGTYMFNNLNSQLSITQNGTAYTGSNITGILFGALVDTAASEVMFTVSKANVSTFTYRVGANTLLSGSSNRYASLYFKRFSYPAVPLALPKLQQFNGSLSNKTVNLNWKFETLDGMSQCILERTNTANEFENVAYYLFDKGNFRSDFSYNDPVQDGRTYYYRLKMTGDKGEIRYSNTLAFSTKAVTNNGLNVFPSFVQSAATININVAQNENTVLRISDINGRMVYQQQVSLKKGSNNISHTGFDRYVRGNYVVSVNTSQGVIAKQIVVN